MKKSTQLIVLCCLSLVVGASLIFSGVISYRPAGICFGLCEQERRADFDRLFPEWFLRESECGPHREADRELIARLYPDLLSDVAAKNQSFSILAGREQNGTLSLGERDQYLNDPWRVVLMVQKEYQPGDFLSGTPQELPYEANSTWIRQCSENGLNGVNYCDGFVSVTLRTVSGGYASSGSRPINHWSYVHLREGGSIDAFIEQMTADSLRDYDLRRAAEDQVQAMPASEFPLESAPFYDFAVKNRVEQVYLESKCS